MMTPMKGRNDSEKIRRAEGIDRWWKRQVKKKQQEAQGRRFDLSRAFVLAALERTVYWANSHRTLRGDDLLKWLTDDLGDVLEYGIRGAIVTQPHLEQMKHTLGEIVLETPLLQNNTRMIRDIQKRIDQSMKLYGERIRPIGHRPESHAPPRRG